MAKLRQRKSNSSNNDSKEKTSSQPETPPKSLISADDIKKENSPSGRSVPDILYAEDGQTFYPCKHCCRAFANQPDLTQHSTVCAGGRGSPSPFSKKPFSNKENLTTEDDEVNNNDDLLRTPTARGRKRKIEVKKITPKVTVNRKRRIIEGDKKRRIRSSSPNCDTNVVTTESVGENINNLTEEMKETVLKNINTLLASSKVSVVARKDGPIVVQIEQNGDQPPLEISSRNIDDHCVEIKTRKVGTRLPNEQLPDISGILENNFGNVKPRRPDYYPLSPETSHSASTAQTESKCIKTSPKCPKSINQESIMDESEIEEIVINTEELEDAAAIVLEDLDIHICKQCGAVYHTLEDLVNHDKYEHRNVKKRYPPYELEKFHNIFKSSDSNVCPICEKTLSSRNAWPRHLQTHSVVLNFECTICKKKFTRDDHRKIHEKRHVVVLKSEEED